MNRTRTFLGLAPSQELRDRVARLQAELKGELPALRWVDPRSFHLTLRFLGEVEACRIGEIVNSIAPIVRKIPRFDCSLEGIGAFPNESDPRVLWVGVGEDAGRLALIDAADRIESALAELGFPRTTEPYQPHLTLARIRGDRTAVAARLAASKLLDTERKLGSFVVERFDLFESLRGPAGAEYTSLAVLPLQAGE